MTGTNGIRSHVRMADALRRDIVYGHLPPGARIPQRE
jgi:DNA-binding GntR family transcriptional regulator